MTLMTAKQDRDLSDWYTCQLCQITYNPVAFVHEHPHCKSMVEEAHWLTRVIVGALFGKEST